MPNATESASTHSEPTIIVNGHLLDRGQSMTIRVALNSFIQDLNASECPLGNDEHGRAMTKLYKERIAQIFQMMK